MNRLALIIRFLLFTGFFLAGALAVVLSMLARPELYDYYHNRAALEKLHTQNEGIAELTAQYADRIALIESEPAILRRFSAATFNRRPTAADTVFPEASSEKLKAETRKILNTQTPPAPVDPLPEWLKRIIEPATRTALFVAGMALIMITFIFFGTPRRDDAV